MSCPNTDRIAVLTKRDRIGNQVHEHLRQTCFQPVNDNRLLGDVGDVFNTFNRRFLTQKFVQVANHFQQIEGLLFFLDQFAIKPRGIGNVADQTVQTAHVMVDDIQQLLALVITFGHAHRSHGRAERRERVLDFMGHICCELFVRINAVVKRCHHAAQRAGQATDLIRARGQIGDADAAWRHLPRILVAAQFCSSSEVG